MIRANPTTLFLATGLLGAVMIVGYGVVRLMPAGRVAPPAEVRPLPAAVPPAAVVVARRPVRRGDLITADDLDLMPTGVAPPGSAAATAAVIGKIAVVDIAAYQLVLSGMISADPARAGLATLVPPGMRALQLRTTDEVAVGNFIRAGDHVDILLVLPDPVLPVTGEVKAQGSDAEARTLLQDVAVLAVGDQLGDVVEAPVPGATAVQRRPEPPRGVTVALSPEQVTRFTLARSLGTLFLALRNPADRQTGATPNAGLAELRATAPTAGPRPIELISGNQSRVIYAGSAAPTPQLPTPQPGTPQPGTPQPSTPQPGTPQPGTPQPEASK